MTEFAGADFVRAMVGISLQWSSFEEGLRQKNRIVPYDPDFAADMVERCLGMRTTREADTVLFRALIMPVGHKAEDGPYPLTEVGARPPQIATGGRLNPPGIPHLYLADDRKTAIAELRPWPEALITVAQFRLEKACDLVTLLDRSREGDLSLLWLANVLARPAHRDDQLAYVATQYLAESLKSRGVDGIEYRSSFNPRGAHNVVLFDLTSAVAVATELHEVETVDVGSTRVVGCHPATRPPPG